MGIACSIHGENMNAYEVLVGKPVVGDRVKLIVEK
jgi:hypothetical protein